MQDNIAYPSFMRTVSHVHFALVRIIIADTSASETNLV